jgi:hypothetical protein
MPRLFFYYGKKLNIRGREHPYTLLCCTPTGSKPKDNRSQQRRGSTPN